MSMSVEQIPLSWDERLLHQVANLLVSKPGGPPDDPVDLGDLLCVVPGSRSGRMLLAELAATARALGRSVVPPQVVTPGALVEALGAGRGAERDAGQPPAPPASRLFAWVEALERCAEDDARALGAARDAGGHPLGRRVRLAQQLIELVDDLAAEGRTLDQAAVAAGRLAGDAEGTRFLAASRVAELAAALLGDAGFEEPSRAESQCADAAAPRPGGPTRLALIATIELNTVQRRAVAAFAARGGEVSAIVHADERWRTRLDELGCIVPGPWIDEPCALGEEEIVIAERASDAAQCVVDAIAEVAAERSADEVTIGLVDPELGTWLQEAARWAGLSLRPAGGRSLCTTAPWQVVAALGRGVRGDDDIVRLARMPAVARWLRGRRVGGRRDDGADSTGPADHVDLLAALDSGLRAARPGGEGHDASALREARRAIESLLAPLTGPARPLCDWPATLRALLADVLADPAEATDDEEAHDAIAPAAIAAIADELAAWSRLPPAVSPKVDGPAAMALLADRTAALSAPLPRRRDDIDVLGWLELHFDDAPVLIVAGAHEGHLPRPASRATADLMPEALRREMGLVDGRALACRDAYLFAAMRRGRVVSRVVAARRDAAGAPLAASRFLVNAPSDRAAARLRRVASIADAVRIAEPRGLAPPAAASAFVVPPPPGSVPIERVAVTAFRAFLACPYRFWLRHVVGLEAVEAPGPQLGADEFGTLAHEVLRRFGADESAREGTSPRRIGDFLDAALDDELRRRFGSARGPGAPVAVRVQAARLRERLAVFAAVQAARRRDGWRIERVEWGLPPTAILPVEGEPPVRVTGRIDRVDRHDDGRVMLLDYKTADTRRTPRQAHRGAARPDAAAPWLDLQLPLYAHLWRLVEGGEVPATGYVALPRDPADVALLPFDLDEDELDEAIENARVIVALMRRGGYVMSADFDGRDDFATICHARSLGRALGGDDASFVAAGDGGGVG